jgi:hypothetical protein
MSKHSKLRFGKLGCAGAVVVLMLGAGMRTSPVAAQQQQPGSIPPLSQPTSAPHVPGMGTADSAPDPVRATMREEMLRAANEQRHKKMLDDANKMVQLSNELKAEVEKTQKDELSVQVLKKAAEVEKLAHDVQQRMKQ